MMLVEPVHTVGFTNGDEGRRDTTDGGEEQKELSSRLRLGGDDGRDGGGPELLMSADWGVAFAQLPGRG